MAGGDTSGRMLKMAKKEAARLEFQLTVAKIRVDYKEFVEKHGDAAATKLAFWIPVITIVAIVCAVSASGVVVMIAVNWMHALWPW